MKPRWFENITFDDLPDDFKVSALEMEEAVLPLLPVPENGQKKAARELARKIALECVKADMVVNEGRNNRYYPWFEGDKFTPKRHEAIRSDYWAKKANGTFELRAFLDKWDITERTLSTIRTTGKDPRQTEAFPDLD